MKMNDWIHILTSFVLCMGFIFLLWTGDSLGERLFALLGMIWFGNSAYNGLFERFSGEKQ